MAVDYSYRLYMNDVNKKTQFELDSQGQLLNLNTLIVWAEMCP